MSVSVALITFTVVYTCTLVLTSKGTEYNVCMINHILSQCCKVLPFIIKCSTQYYNKLKKPFHSSSLKAQPSQRTPLTGKFFLIKITDVYVFNFGQNWFLHPDISRESEDEQPTVRSLIEALHMLQDILTKITDLRQIFIVFTFLTKP